MTTSWGRSRPRRERGELRRETGESLYLLALTAAVLAGTVALGMLAVWFG